MHPDSAPSPRPHTPNTTTPYASPGPGALSADRPPRSLPKAAAKAQPRSLQVRLACAVLFDPLAVGERVSAPGLLEVLLLVKGLGVLDPVLDNVLEGLDQPLHGPGCRIAQRADGVALDLAGDLLEHGDLALVGLAALHADQDALQPAGALAAGRALAAALVLVEVREPADGSDHVHGVVHDGDGRCAQAGAPRLKIVKIHQRLRGGLVVQHGHAGPARDHRLQVVPAAAHAAAVLLQQVLQRDGHLLLHDHGVVHVPTDAEELGAVVVGAAEAGEPGGAATQDGGAHSDGLHVGHGGGAAKDTHVGREGRLQAGFPSLALQGLDERGLLAADVGARAAVQVHVKVVAGATGVLAQEALGVSLVDGLIQHNSLVEVLAANIDVGRPGPHSEPGDETALHQLVGVLAHDLAVLASARLGLIGVYHQEAGATIVVLGHKRPLQAGRETSTSAATEP
mmetsp:Transcript_35252/g.64064  ORF Transcript_35252/g.64064 Transcript_35252/m.64064 type:complete len:454 (-) Transcript_35252:330-1691(-)